MIDNLKLEFLKKNYNFFYSLYKLILFEKLILFLLIVILILELIWKLLSGNLNLT